ncbi:metalloregulator ArsR/SmtB family transcription factor [Halomonas sp. NO4]|uniref:helix-turn-helix transcriptional regulator n=1 Tax=Halomonas sp. NO4 TaxID=2484813 RepID=UPI0013CF84EE|nr:metalloregulator ArsR/SmtB family transcription factor [Halomonas sp. NO4]
MSSDANEKPAPSSTAERLLHLLKTEGPDSAAALGERLGTTGENARQHLIKLARQGLVTHRNRSRGVGRPQAEWRLTEAGHRHFPDTHAELATRLIASVRDTLGPEALDTLVAARERETLAHYRQALKGLETLEARVAALAALRSREGYMAEWRAESDGSLLLIEHHCPICSAARACPRFCEAELSVFRAVLGDGVSVERDEHLLAGARRCAYRIIPP